MENFGLINRTYPADKQTRKNQSLTQWERFYDLLSQLNEKASKHIEYKVLFLGRHGEGWHNAAETYYGTPAWNVRISLKITQQGIKVDINTL